MTYQEALPEIKEMLDNDTPRAFISSWIMQNADVSKATSYRWIGQANQEDENGLTPQQQALEFMLNLMHQREGEGDLEGALKIAEKIAKCK